MIAPSRPARRLASQPEGGSGAMSSPAFFNNLAHLLIGPLWVMNHFLGLRKTQSSIN